MRAATFRETYKDRHMVNVSDDVIVRHIRSSIRRQLPQVGYWPVSPQKVVLLAGGPSLNDHVDDIRQMKRRGWKVAACNNTHDWALERGIRPGVQGIVDARPFNARFVQNPVDSCRYLVCSQCHPDVFDALDGCDVHIWHSAGKVEKPILDKFYNGRYNHMHGGSTIGTRMIWLLYALGIRKIAIYGMDCCLRRGEHHAYEQEENASKKRHEIVVGGRRFVTHPWMTMQCDEFLRMLPVLPGDLKLDFRGGGLISHIIKCTALKGRPPKMRIVKEIM